MKIKKTPFFIKLKNAVVNFDSYKNFAEEKTFDAIKYILKLVLIFTLIITCAITFKLTKVVNQVIENFKNDFPEFSFQDNKLIVEGEEKSIIKGDEAGYISFIINSNEEDLSNIAEAGDYQRVIACLKDKIVIKNVDNTQSNITYEQLAENYNYDLKNFNKESVLQLLSRK